MELAAQVEAALAAVAESVPAVDFVAATGPEGWLIGTDAITVVASLPRGSNRLTLEAEVGWVRDDAPAAVYAALLSWSLLWRGTGGGRFALADDGTLSQIVDVAATALTPELAAARLESLIAAARDLPPLLATLGHGSDLPAFDMIRV